VVPRPNVNHIVVLRPPHAHHLLTIAEHLRAGSEAGAGVRR
jgi:hypothetical protein